MKKYIVAVLAVLTLCVAFCITAPDADAATVASGTCGVDGDNLTWTLDDEGTLTISGTGAMKNWTYSSSAPWYSRRSAVKKVVIGNSVTTIGDYAFYNCYSLTSVTIPDSVTTIGEWAFYYCTGLTAVTIPDSVTTIGKEAFYWCTGLKSMTIPDSVTTIGKDAFYNTAWYNNQPDGLVYAGKVAYKYKGTCPATVTIKDGTLGITDYAFYYCTGLKSVTIPASVTTIGGRAFYYCTGLKSVTIPDSVTTIGGYAFYKCTGLTSVSFGKSVTTIGEEVLNECINLVSIWVDPDNQNYSSDSYGVLFNKSKTTLIKVPDKISGAYSIPDTVTAIEKYAFYSCELLTSISIGKNVTTVGEDAFYNCANVEKLYYNAIDLQTIPDDGLFTYRDDYTYWPWPDGEPTYWPSDYFSSKSMEIIIGADVRILPEMLFKTNLEFVDEHVEGGGSYCDILSLPIAKVIFEGPAPRFAEDTFSKVTTTAYYPSGEPSWTEEVRQNYGGNITWELWTDPNLEWTVDDNGQVCITGIVDKTATELTIPASILNKPVTTIAPNAFSGCSKLTKVTLPSTIVSSGNGAFKDCNALKEVHISDVAAWCGVFFDGRNSNPVYKSRKLYVNGTLLTNLVIPEGVESVGDYAFYGCTDIKNLQLPNSLKTIGLASFTACNGLTSLTIPENVTNIDLDAFNNYYYLTELHWNAKAVADLPESKSMFKKAGTSTDGVTLTFGENVTYIPAYLFDTAEDKATNIKRIIFKGAAPEIGENAFKTVTATASYDINDRTWLGKQENYGGTLTWTTYGEVEAFEIPVSRMILGNALEFQFGVEKTAQTDWTGAYAIIEKSWADGTTTQEIVPFEQWDEVGPYYAIVYDGLAAKEMGDTITVTIYNGDDVAISVPKVDSARDYVKRAFDSQPDTGKTMMVDMLNYGAAAQAHFGYAMNDLANSQLTEAQKAYGTTAAPAMGNYQFKGQNYLGTRFILESRIQIQVAFSGLTDGMYAIYNYTDSSGKTRSVRVESDQFITAGSMRGIELSKLVYADARGQVTIMVYKADGTLHGMAIDSIESCASRSSGDVFAALMKFADSAKNHLYD